MAKGLGLSKLLYKISQCISYDSLYALEEEFNRNGLTVQTSSGNRMMLCRLKDGKAITENVIDDYIFVGDLNDRTKEISERAAEKICEFVETHAGESDEVKNMPRVWRNGLRMYGGRISIQNEDVQKALGSVLFG